MTERGWLTAHKDGIVLHVQLLPRSSANEIRGLYNQRIKVSVTAPPVEGAANAALIEFVSQLLSTAKSAIEILRGQQHKSKDVFVRGLTIAQAEERIRTSKFASKI